MLILNTIQMEPFQFSEAKVSDKNVYILFIYITCVGLKALSEQRLNKTAQKIPSVTHSFISIRYFHS